ncbi:MAG: potassium channel protein [Bacteroidetes bacterium]|nr:MAG: potassium channel protein [Bacteroidota bacterium]
MSQRNLLRIYRLPSHFLSLRIALFLLLGELLLGVLGFIFLEGYSLIDAVYMVIITLSTVGFSEVKSLSDAGRVFTAAFIILNIGIFTYVVAAFSYYIIEGEFFKQLHLKYINDHIAQLKGHVILCGYGKYGHEIVANLQLHAMPFVILENDPEKIKLLRESDENILYIEGDATQDELLHAAGVERARGLISALQEDSDNLFIVLSARALNPHLLIISRAMHKRSQAKLMKAGANHVVMPENIGGFYMATLINKPGAVEFFGFITNEFHSDVGFEELTYDKLPEAYRGKPISALQLRPKTGANIIGYRNRKGQYQVNPPPNTVLREGETFIVLGSEEQLTKLRDLCGIEI